MLSHRTQSLIDRVPDHPLAATIKNAMVDALTAAEAFRLHNASLKKAGTLTTIGQRQALQEEFTKNAARRVVRAADPIRKARKDIQHRREGLTIKAIDPANVTATLDRQEIRAWLRSLDLNARQATLHTTKDKRILEAVVTAPPELSGILELGPAAEGVANSVEARYLEMEYGSEMRELEALDRVVSEGEAVAAIARNDLMSELELDQREFNELMRPIEQGVGRPWLIKRPRIAGSGRAEDDVIVCEILPDGSASYRDATAEDQAAGVFYRDAAEYRAASGLAA